MNFDPVMLLGLGAQYRLYINRTKRLIPGVY
jgi:protein-S-isoprenylcysteine O-methyltransferase Ste14